MTPRLLRPALVLAAATGLAACSAYDGYGHGYGYGRVAVGYPTHYHPRAYFGWFGGYYYPGVGVYIYDRFGTRHRWSSRHRRYWLDRRPRYGYRENWSGYRYRRGDRYRDERRDYYRDRDGDYRRDRRRDRRRRD